ncbi:hypothetical protein CYMTET_37405 [Cymbomonas tetramitiformis]|uniref:Uncharacterized protein n=1 Tax=Cymbomonas tetramitiformis TaxID=36881 RepID=A0AAE0CE81_9CHLO|nr:hypothetical protein CYMTET_37405 [Cymbomonas tetramitiformis]
MKKEISEVDFCDAEKSRGRDAECIYLTGDCFKALCMTARTEQGKRVRKYYLALEKRLRDGDLTLAGEIVENYDAENGTTTNVLLRTNATGVSDGPPEWVPLWKRARGNQKEIGKIMRDMLRQKGVSDLRVYQEVENMHNQSVLGFEGWTKKWLRNNGICVESGAEAMDQTQLSVREQFSGKLIEKLAEMDNPTAEDIKNLTRQIKGKVDDYASWLGIQEYRPETDDGGRRVPCGKRVRQLVTAYRRSLKRLATIERKQALLTVIESNRSGLSMLSVVLPYLISLRGLDSTIGSPT